MRTVSSSLNVLVVCDSLIARDPRVMRQVRALMAAGHRVAVAGFGGKPDADVVYHPLALRARSPWEKLYKAVSLLVGRFNAVYWSEGFTRQVADILREGDYDVIVANDLMSLPVTVTQKRGARVIYDAHEYSPREFENSRMWRLFYMKYHTWLCREYLGRTDAMTTIGPSIAEAYRKHFGVDSAVVYSASEYRDLQPTPVSDRAIRMIHHGGADPGRSLDLMIRMMDLLDERFTLDLMLVPMGGGDYRQTLQAMAAGNDRIRFLDPVPMEQICQTIHQYDVGLFFVPPTTFNLRWTLPNKFFEFVQARLALAIGPSPEMKRLLDQYDLGVVAEDFSVESMARALNALTADQIRQYKWNAHEAAHDLSFERNAQAFLTLVEG